MAGLSPLQPRRCSVEATYTDNEDARCWQKKPDIDPWQDPLQYFFIQKVSKHKRVAVARGVL